MQAQMKAKYGYVLGCPLFSVGAEVSTQETRLQKKIEGILNVKRKYLESTIRDAHAAGIIDAPDAAAKARTLFAFYQGIVTDARIRNDLEVLRDGMRGTYELLGVKEPATVAA
jgi:TetR/AcrR family transcriptional repressor of nem operon